MGFTTLEEIIKFAVQREKTAYQLYKDAAEKSTSIAPARCSRNGCRREGTQGSIQQDRPGGGAGFGARTSVDMKLGDYLVDIPLRPNMTYQEILTYAMKTRGECLQALQGGGRDDR